MTPLNLGAGVSAAATLLALALLALAARRLAAVLRSGPRNAVLPPRRVPVLLAGWIGLVTFAAGLYAGHLYWH